MRLIAEHPKQELIGKFLHYIQARGITAEMRAGNSVWGVWVHHEDFCREARSEFDAFMCNPAAAKYDVQPPALPREVSEPEAEKHKVRKAALTMAAAASRRHGLLRDQIPVTIGLLALSTIVTLPLLLGRQNGDFSDAGKMVVGALYADARMSTQWWRILTPAFLHFNWLHIIFNMLWLRELGGRIERIKGHGFMLLFFVVSAGVSNYAQYLAGGGNLFGGMSGVVYGLFGYIWVKSRFFPEEGFFIDSATVMMLMIWFFLGWSGFAGPIANWAHGFGLLSGVALALGSGARLQGRGR